MSIDKLELPAVVRALLKSFAARVDKRLRTTHGPLWKELAARGYAKSVALGAFETRYGGLCIPDGDAEWIVGAHACQASDAHRAPRGGRADLVPVVYSPNDVVFFLDKVGRALAQDTIEDSKAAPYARDARGMLSRIVLEKRADDLGREERKGAHAKTLAKQLGAARVKEACGKDADYFADARGDVVIIERGAAGKRTTIVAQVDGR